jgi:hypothetical protein
VYDAGEKADGHGGDLLPAVVVDENTVAQITPENEK